LIVNAVRYVVNKIRGKDDDSTKDEGGESSKKSCMLTTQKNGSGNDPSFNDVGSDDKLAISTYPREAKQPCTSPGG